MSIKFIAAFPEGNKVVEVSSPNGGGGRTYHIMVDNRYCGIIGYYTTGWQVHLNMTEYQFTGGDLQPLLDLVDTSLI